MESPEAFCVVLSRPEWWDWDRAIVEIIRERDEQHEARLAPLMAAVDMLLAVVPGHRTEKVEAMNNVIKTALALRGDT